MIKQDPQGWRPKARKPLIKWYKSHKVPTTEVLCCTEVKVFPLIQKFLRNFRPVLMVEFGTTAGGMTLCLHEARPSTPLWSFDNYNILAPRGKVAKRMRLPILNQATLKEHQEALIKTCFNKNVHFVQMDLLSEPQSEVIDLLKRKERKFLYCDGGDKVKEVCMYARYLNPGDVLGVHDWSREIDLSWPGIKEALSCFDDLPVNKKFISQNLMVRLFVKSRY